MAGATLVVVVVLCATEGATVGLGATTGCVDTVTGTDDGVVGVVDAVTAAVTGCEADVVAVERCGG